MSKESLAFSIDDVGGVDHLDLNLRLGVNVLKGRNAAGKTSAIEAVARAQGAKLPLEKRDGSDVGRVEGPGVVLNVRQVVKATGYAEVELADVGPIARLIEPNLKNTDAAARERIRALVELLGLSVDDEYLRVLAGKDESLFGWLKGEVRKEAVDDLMKVAEMLRNKSHSLAREQEEIAAKAEGIIEASTSRCEELLEKLGGELSKEDAETANEFFLAGVREHDRELAKAEAREKLVALQAKIRETIGGDPEIELGDAEMRVSVAKSERRLIEEEIDGLEDKLREARIAKKAADDKVAREEEILEEKKKASEKFVEQQKVLGEKVEGPTLEEVEALKPELVDRRKDKLERARISDSYRIEEAAKNEAERAKDKGTKGSEYFRGVAASIPKKLGEILALAGAPGLTVVDGRLAAITDKGTNDFETRCSTGEKVALALSVAARAYKGRVLPLSGEFWISLDPENKKRFAELAAENGLFVITEEPANGDLRVESV